MSDAIVMFTIYERPRDAPAHYVVRRWTVARGGAPAPDQAHPFDTIGEARASIPPGCVCLPRQLDDDPCIVETWI